MVRGQLQLCKVLKAKAVEKDEKIVVHHEKLPVDLCRGIGLPVAVFAYGADIAVFPSFFRFKNIAILFPLFG
jgi:hypothetical protein